MRLTVAIVVSLLLASAAGLAGGSTRRPFLLVATQDPQPAQALRPGESVRRAVVGNEEHEYVVATGDTPTAVRFRLSIWCCAGIVAEFKGPDGKVLHRTHAEWRFWPVSLSYVADAAGEYRVVLRRMKGDTGAGDYELRFESKAPASPSDRDQVKAEQMLEAARRPLHANSETEVRAAIESLQPLVDLFARAGDARGQSDVLLRVADAYADLGQLSEAIGAHRKRAVLLDAIGDTKGAAGALDCVRLYAQQVGDYQLMLEAGRQAAEKFTELGEPALMGEGWVGLANSYWAVNDPRRAAEAYDEADALDRSSTRSTGYLREAGIAYDFAGMQATALARFQTGAEVAEKADLPGQCFMFLSRAAAMQARLGHREQALATIDRILARWQPKEQQGYWGPETFAFIGRAYGYLGERQLAVPYLDRAAALGGQPSAAGTQASRTCGFASPGYLLVGEYGKALQCDEASLAVFRSPGGMPHREASLEASIAVEERALGHPDAARAHIERAMRQFESLRGTIASPDARAEYQSTIHDVYALYIDLLMESAGGRPRPEDVAGALAISERARGRSLLELLGEAQVDIREGVDTALVEREQALERGLDVLARRQATMSATDRGTPAAADLAKEIERRSAERQRVSGLIRQASPRYAELKAPTPLDVLEVQRQVLDADTLLLEYALGTPRSYLWVVSRDGLASFVLPAEQVIEGHARRVYESLTARSRRVPGETDAARQTRIEKAQAAFPAATAALAESVLGPAASLLGTRRLLIVTQGALQYIPFAALPDPASARRPGTRPPLIVAHELVYAPSASVLAALRRETAGRAAPSKTLAVLADPVFDRDDARVKPGSTTSMSAAPAAVDRRQEARLRSALERSLGDTDSTADGRLPRLIYSRSEAAAITSSLPAGQALEALDFDASKRLAMSAGLADYRFVHLATHGVLNSANATLSGLVLSLVDERGEPQDGFLRLNDIFNMKLRADLVVLSACQTALGQDIRGEGLVGLTRGFMYAGASRVVASLWKVNDAKTAGLMERFYRDMLARGMRPAEALRSAQLGMLQDRRLRDPYYWAAFQLQGEWR